MQELIIKGQRLERLKELKVENEQAYLSSKLLEQQYAQKKEVVKGIKREAKEAAKTGRSKKVRSLIGEYREKLG